MHRNIKTRKKGNIHQLLPDHANAKSYSISQLKALGIYEEKEVEFDKFLQEKVEGFVYDKDLDEVYIKIVDKELPSIEDIKKQKIDEFRGQFIEMSNIINYCLNNQDQENPELRSLISYVRRLKKLTMGKIDSFTDPAELLKYHFLREDKEGIIEKFKPFM